MKRLIEIAKLSLIIGIITGILPALGCGILFKILGL